MITRTVHVGEATVTLQRETRRVALNRARYLKALEADYPSIKGATFTWFIDETDMERRVLLQAAYEYTQALAQTVNAEHAPVPMPGSVQEVLSPEDVRKGFEHFLDDADGFWEAVLKAMYEMNEPLTAQAERPDEMLTEQQAQDPNS